jgi:hypothetical protein
MKRQVAFGYRTDDAGLNLPPLGETDPDTRFFIKSRLDRPRSPVLASVGCHWQVGDVPVVRPQPDFGHSLTAEQGARKRFVSANLAPDAEFLRGLGHFVKRFLETKMKPLPHWTDVSYLTWRRQINHPEWRKKQFDEAYERFLQEGLLAKDAKVKSFVKREQYPEYKYARDINSRSDKFKVYSGPIFRAIEKSLFSMDYFIKKIPVADRPAYILELLGSGQGKFVATDYTSFEALFTEEIMRTVEMQLYEYMVRDIPGGQEWFSTISRILLGENICWFRDFSIKTRARRMSGEMCTSLGNSFSNLMFMLYVCESLGSTCVGVVEGDDGLFRVNGPVPTANDFARLGLRIKLVEHDEISTASFCGLIFDPTDRVNIRDPRDVLADFAWVDSRYARSRNSKLKTLLRCKALSLAHQYPGCPIISELAQYGLRVTSGIEVEHFVRNSPNLGWWDREILLAVLHKNIPHREPPDNTRELVARLYDIPVDVQKSIETELSRMDTLHPIRLDSLEPKPAWLHYGNHYVHPCDWRKRLGFPGPHPSMRAAPTAA